MVELKYALLLQSIMISTPFHTFTPQPPYPYLHLDLCSYRTVWRMKAARVEKEWCKVRNKWACGGMDRTHLCSWSAVNKAHHLSCHRGACRQRDELKQCFCMKEERSQCFTFARFGGAIRNLLCIAFHNVYKEPQPLRKVRKKRLDMIFNNFKVLLGRFYGGLRSRVTCWAFLFWVVDTWSQHE